jgi:hypothetical protein
MPDFKDLTASALKQIADAEYELYCRRAEAIDAICNGASVTDVMLLAAHMLAMVAPDCCDAHAADFEEDFLKMLHDHQHDDADDADGDEPAAVH